MPDEKKPHQSASKKQDETARERFNRMKSLMKGELSKALQRPSSEYGGPVKISSGVPMKFPYTFTAKIVQFPWKFYYNNNWIFKYYILAVIVCIPIFKSISSQSNSPGNKAKWDEIRQKELHHHEHHHHH